MPSSANTYMNSNKIRERYEMPASDLNIVVMMSFSCFHDLASLNTRSRRNVRSTER